MRHMASHCSPVQELLGYLSGRRYRKADEVYVAAAMATMFIHGLLSVSRVLALYHGELTAPVSVHPSHSWPSTTVSSLHQCLWTPPTPGATLQATTPPWRCTPS